MCEQIAKRCRRSIPGPDHVPDRLGEPNEGPNTAKKRDLAALETPRCADADQLPHQQAEIQRSGMEQHTLEDFVVTPQVYAPHAAGFVEMRKRSFQPFAAQDAAKKEPEPARDVVIERLETTYRYQRYQWYLYDGTGDIIEHKRLRVLTEAGRNAVGQVYFPYSTYEPFRFDAVKKPLAEKGQLSLTLPSAC